MPRDAAERSSRHCLPGGVLQKHSPAHLALFGWLQRLSRTNRSGLVYLPGLDSGIYGLFSCGTYRKVTDAETLAARKATKLDMQMAPDKTTVLCLCLDNLSVARRIQPGFYAHGTSPEMIGEIRRLLFTWQASHPRRCPVQWILGHQSVPENKAADQMAKRGATVGASHVGERYISLAAAKKWREAILRSTFKK